VQLHVRVLIDPRSYVCPGMTQHVTGKQAAEVIDKLPSAFFKKKAPE
jgi:hypothetical protein